VEGVLFALTRFASGCLVQKLKHYFVYVRFSLPSDLIKFSSRYSTNHFRVGPQQALTYDPEKIEVGTENKTFPHMIVKRLLLLKMIDKKK